MRKKISWIISTILVAFLTIMPLYSCFYHGVFSWHISTQGYWRDFFEIFIAFVLIMGLGTFAKNLRGFFIVFIGGLFLLSFGTLIPVIVGYLFIESISIIGKAFNDKIFRNEYTKSIDFFSGSIFLGAIFLVFSLLGLGSIEWLRIAWIIIVCIALLIEAKNISISDLFITKIITKINSFSNLEWYCIAPLIFILLLAFTRINTHLEFDSSWYALYPDKNLFGEKSFFEFLGYTGFVYYYPKFKELLFAPISGLKVPGYLIAPNIWLVVLMIDETIRFIKRKTKNLNNGFVLLVVSLLYSTMAIIGTAGTAKSDTLGYFYLLICWVCFETFLDKFDFKYLWLALSAGIIPFGVKYTHYIWALCLVSIYALYTIYQLLKNKKQFKDCVAGCIVIGLTLFDVAVILFRTLYITGLPFGRIGIGFLNKIGIYGSELFQFSESTNLPSVFEPKRIFNCLIMVGKADKITAQWFGNYMLFVVIFILIAVPFSNSVKKIKDNVLSFIIFVVLNVISIYLLVTMYAPDGNYFEFTLIFSLISLLVIYSDEKCVSSFLFKLSITAFIFLNVISNFTTDPAWGSGTRFAYENLYDNEIKTVKTISEYDDDCEKHLNDIYGISEINKYLTANAKDDYIILDGGDTYLLRLDARIEISTEITNSYLSAENFYDQESFNEFVRKAGVDGFILSNDNSGDQVFEMYAREYLNINGWNAYVEDLKYTYYKIN